MDHGMNDDFQMQLEKHRLLSFLRVPSSFTEQSYVHETSFECLFYTLKRCPLRSQNERFSNVFFRNNIGKPSGTNCPDIWTAHNPSNRTLCYNRQLNRKHTFAKCPAPVLHIHRYPKKSATQTFRYRTEYACPRGDTIRCPDTRPDLHVVQTDRCGPEPTDAI